MFPDLEWGHHDPSPGPSVGRGSISYHVDYNEGLEPGQETRSDLDEFYECVPSTPTELFPPILEA